MKINELIQDFTIQASNEEKAILSKLKEVKRLDHFVERDQEVIHNLICLLYTSPSPRDRTRSRMPSSA